MTKKIGEALTTIIPYSIFSCLLLRKFCNIPVRQYIGNLQQEMPGIIPYGNSLNIMEQSGPILIDDTRQLGATIRSRRKGADLTQKKMAALAGVGTRFLSELERGKPTSEIGKTLRILHLLGLELQITSRK